MYCHWRGGRLYVDDNTQFVDTPNFPQDIKPEVLAARDYLAHLK